MSSAIVAILASYSSSGAWLGEPPSRQGSVAGVEVSAKTGLVPAFRAQERDLLSASAALSWQPADPVVLRLSYPIQAMQFPDESRVLGGGDLRLGAAVLLWSGPFEVWLDQQVKLPNASDERQLGTDETDWLGRCWVAWNGPLRIDGAAGLAILGDPNHFAAQDDAALIDLRVSKSAGPVDLYLWGGGRLASPRNPADLSLRGGVGGLHGRLTFGAEAGLGLTPAAADVGLRAWTGLVF